MCALPCAHTAVRRGPPDRCHPPACIAWARPLHTCTCHVAQQHADTACCVGKHADANDDGDNGKDALHVGGSVDVAIAHLHGADISGSSHTNLLPGGNTGGRCAAHTPPYPCLPVAVRPGPGSARTAPCPALRLSSTRRQRTGPSHWCVAALFMCARRRMHAALFRGQRCSHARGRRRGIVPTGPGRIGAPLAWACTALMMLPHTHLRAPPTCLPGRRPSPGPQSTRRTPPRAPS